MLREHDRIETYGWSDWLRMANILVEVMEEMMAEWPA